MFGKKSKKPFLSGPCRSCPLLKLLILLSPNAKAGWSEAWKWQACGVSGRMRFALSVAKPIWQSLAPHRHLVRIQFRSNCESFSFALFQWLAEHCTDLQGRNSFNEESLGIPSFSVTFSQELAEWHWLGYETLQTLKSEPWSGWLEGSSFQEKRSRSTNGCWKISIKNNMNNMIYLVFSAVLRNVCWLTINLSHSTHSKLPATQLYIRYTPIPAVLDKAPGAKTSPWC